MRYREFQPAASLGEAVRCYWFLDAEDSSSAGPPVERLLPDGSAELILHLGDPFSRVETKGETVQEPSLLVGQLASAFVVRPSRRARVVAVRFEPHGLARFFRFPAEELRDSSVDLSALWGREVAVLIERLQEAPDDGARVDLLDRFLMQRRVPRLSRGFELAAVVGALRASEGRLRIDALARDAGVSTRSLERSFRRDVGLSPKRLSRVFRLQAALAMLRAGAPSLAEVALATGHADQPHLDREFRDLAGLSPASFRSGPPALDALIASS